MQIDEPTMGGKVLFGGVKTSQTGDDVEDDEDDEDDE